MNIIELIKSKDFDQYKYLTLVLRDYFEDEMSISTVAQFVEDVTFISRHHHSEVNIELETSGLNGISVNFYWPDLKRETSDLWLKSPAGLGPHLQTLLDILEAVPAKFSVFLDSDECEEIVYLIYENGGLVQKVECMPG